MTVPRTIALAALAALLLGGSPIAGARADNAIHLVDQTPESGRISRQAAAAIALRFDRPVDHRRSRLTLVSRSGTRALKPRLNAEPATLYAMPGVLAPGRYELRWTARAMDGQMMSGSFPFDVQPDQRRLVISGW